MMQDRMFPPDRLIETAQFGLTPIETIILQLNASAASADGSPDVVSYPQYSGNGFYCEYCDVPGVTINFTNQLGSVESSVPLREGLEIRAPFKGFTLTIPKLVSSSTQFKAKILLTSHASNVSNQLASPFYSDWGRFMVDTDTANLQTGRIHIPVGARLLEALDFTLGALSVTSATIQMLNAKNSTLQSGEFQDPRSRFTYVNNANWGVIFPPVAENIGGGLFQLSLKSKYTMHSEAVFLQYSIVGTGMGANRYCRTLFS